MDSHIFKPGDMALITGGKPSVPKQANCLGLTCIVESHPYLHPDFPITAVNITIGVPGIERADVRCLKYIPPDEWPESKYKVRELVRVEGASHGTQEHSTPKQRELETAK